MEQDLIEIKKLRNRLRATDNPALVRIQRSRELRSFRREVIRGLQKQVSLIVNERLLQEMGFVEKMQDRPQRALDLAFDKYPLGNFINAYEYLKYTGEIGGRTALDKLGISLNFAIKDKKLIAMLKDSENFLLSSVDKTTKEWIAAKIAEEFDKFGFAKDEAKTFRKIAEDINQMFKEISVSRAELIISNEAANAAAIVEEKTFKENGARYWTWATNNDGRVTAGCLENQAAGRRRIGDAFPSGHTRNPRFPGCRCWMEPDLDTLFPVSYVYTG